MHRILGASLSAMLLLMGPPVAAQPATTQAAAVLEPAAIGMLDRMGAYLRTLTRWEVRADATTEEVFDNGQKLQFLQRTTYTVALPDRMKVDIVGDRFHRQVWLDGKTMTVAGLGVKKYVQLPVTAPVGEVVRVAADDYGINLPLLDLFLWGSPDSAVEKPSSGFRVGDARIGDTAVGHYAFRQPGVDFQLWIEEGDRPLPRKMVITNTENPAQPQYVATFTWNLSPTIGADSFTFNPAGFTRIEAAK
ncbi:DUF2092 domain-containing protein [Thermaurantiacus sp.]